VNRPIPNTNHPSQQDQAIAHAESEANPQNPEGLNLTKPTMLLEKQIDG
jgi:hypothetical protein